MKKLFRISTVPVSLNILLKGQLEYLNQFYDVTAISGAGKDLDEVHQRERVKIHPIEMQRQISPFKDLKSLIQLYNYFRKEKPQIVHSITPKAGLLSMLAGKMAGVPIRIHTFTGLVFPYKTGKMQTLLIAMDKLLCWAATDIIPEGNGVKQDLIKFEITKKPLEIVGNGNVNGIDLEVFHPGIVTVEEKERLRKKWGIREQDKVLIFVGRLVKDKGINELIAAFKSLQSINEYQAERNEIEHERSSTAHQLTNATTLKLSDIPTYNVKLLLVGPYEQDLDPLQPETIKEIEENPNIIHVGFQKDVRSFLGVADLLVFPSYREGFPNVVLQALAMELPAVVTDINGSNEIITDQINGLIIETKNTEQIAEAVGKLLMDNELYAKLKSNTRHSILPFKNTNIWNELNRRYRKHLSQ